MALVKVLLMYRICLIIISVEKLVIIKFAYNCFTMVIQYVISVLVRRLMLIIQTIKFATLRYYYCVLYSFLFILFLFVVTIYSFLTPFFCFNIEGYFVGSFYV